MALLDIEKALKELREKSMVDIERATALTWGGRAAASYRLSQESKETAERFRHFYEGENYRQEAMEHAAMAEDDARLLRDIHNEVEKERRSALQRLQGQAKG